MLSTICINIKTHNNNCSLFIWLF